MTNRYDHDCKCCPGDAGPAGPMGPQGPQGQQGLQGISGKDGLQGVTGAVGPQGLQGSQGISGQVGAQGIPGAMGPQGSQGPQGLPGECVECDCHCMRPEFAEVYSNVQQNLIASPGLNQEGGVVNLEQTIHSTANIDVSSAAINGRVIINKAGWYDVTVGASGALNPVSSPLPVWTVSLFKNSIIVPGSTFSNMTLSPVQQSNLISADVLIHFDAGDYIELVNTSTNPIILTAPSFGTNAQTNSAFLKIVLLEEG